MSAHVTHNSGNNEWYTPTPLIESARTVLGTIDCDPASSDIANRAVRAAVHFTKEQDGLAQPVWGDRVWMNPPYAQPWIAQFAASLRDRALKGEVKQACVLVNNATETGWFDTLMCVASAVCFLRKRVRFIDPEGRPSGAPLQGQAIIYIGEDVAAFAAEFRQHGTVMQVLR